MPFVPGARRRAIEQPELDLLELAALWKPFDYRARARRRRTTARATRRSRAIATELSRRQRSRDLGARHADDGRRAGRHARARAHRWSRRGAGRGPAPAIDRGARGARAAVRRADARRSPAAIVAGGMPFGGDVRRASVVVRAGGRPVDRGGPGRRRHVRGDACRRRRDRPSRCGRSAGTRARGRGRRRRRRHRGAAAGDRCSSPSTRGGDRATTALVAFHPADEATRAAVDRHVPRPVRRSARRGSARRTARRRRATRCSSSPQGTERRGAGRPLPRVRDRGARAHARDRASVELVAGEIAPVALVARAARRSRRRLAVGRPPRPRPRELRLRASPTTIACARSSPPASQVIAATDHDVIGDYTADGRDARARRSDRGDGRARGDAAHPVARRARRGRAARDRPLQLLAARAACRARRAPVHRGTS